MHGQLAELFFNCQLQLPNLVALCFNLALLLRIQVAVLHKREALHSQLALLQLIQQLLALAQPRLVGKQFFLIGHHIRRPGGRAFLRAGCGHWPGSQAGLLSTSLLHLPTEH